MANTASAKKEIRAQRRKTQKNLKHKRAFRAAKKEVDKAIESGKKTKVDTAVQKYYKTIDKASKVDALHKNTAARYKSRLMKVIAQKELK